MLLVYLREVKFYQLGTYVTRLYAFSPLTYSLSCVGGLIPKPILVVIEILRYNVSILDMLPRNEVFKFFD